MATSQRESLAQKLEGFERVVRVLTAPGGSLGYQMSITVDVFIKFEGSKANLVKMLAKDFLILVGEKEYWFLGFIEVGLSSRAEDKEYFHGHRFRPYDYVLSGTTYAWSSRLGAVGCAHTTIFDTIAQMLAVKLKTRTMFSISDWGDERRYRCVRPMKRNKFSSVIDEKTGRPPKGLF
jgi:hypothetical protein